MLEAQRNIAAGLNQAADAKVIELHRADDTEKNPLFKQAVGGVDLDRMNRNAAKRRENSR